MTAAGVGEPVGLSTAGPESRDRDRLHSSKGDE